MFYPQICSYLLYFSLLSLESHHKAKQPWSFFLMVWLPFYFINFCFCFYYFSYSMWLWVTLVAVSFGPQLRAWYTQAVHSYKLSFIPIINYWLFLFFLLKWPMNKKFQAFFPFKYMNYRIHTFLINSSFHTFYCFSVTQNFLLTSLACGLVRSIFSSS